MDVLVGGALTLSHAFVNVIRQTVLQVTLQLQGINTNGSAKACR